MTPATAADAYQVTSLAEFTDAPVTHLALDTPAHQIVAVHAGSISRLDTRSNEKIGNLEFAGEITGIALVPRDRRGFVSLGPKGSVQAFDLDSGEVLDSIEIPGAAPAFIADDPASRRQFVADSSGDNLVILDSAAGNELERVALGGRAGPMVTDGRGHLFGVVAGAPAIFVLDTRTLEPLGQFGIAGCGAATGIDMDPVERRLFVPCDNTRLFVLDSDTGLVLSRLPIGTGNSAVALDFEIDRKVNIFVASADGSITVGRVAKVTFSVRQTLTGPAPGTSLVFDEGSGQAYYASGSGLAIILSATGDPR